MSRPFVGSRLRHKIGGVLVTPTGVAPFFTVAPTIPSTPIVGVPSTFNSGTWSGTSPITAHTRFVLDGADVGSVDDAVYTPAVGSDGKTLQVRVSLTNSVSTVSQLSAGVVIAAAPSDAGYGASADAGEVDTPSTYPAYNPTTVYYPGSQVTYNSVAYWGKSNSGIANGAMKDGWSGLQPDTNPSYWVPVTGVRYMDGTNGNDTTGDGLTPATAWKTLAFLMPYVSSNLGKTVLPTGTVILFARGTPFPGQLQVNPSTNPSYLFGAYGTGARPAIQWTNDPSPATINRAPVWINRANMIIKNLSVDGRYPTYGVKLSGIDFDSSDCAVINCDLINAGGDGLSLTGGVANRMYAKNSSITYCGLGGHPGNGIGGGGSNVLAENLTVWHCGVNTLLSHNIYFGHWGSGTTIRKCDVAFGSNFGINSGFEATTAFDPVIEDNLIHHNQNGMDLGTSSFGNAERWQGTLTIRRNRIYLNGISQGTQGTAIYTINSCDASAVENNLIYGNYGSGIEVNRSTTATDPSTLNVDIRNNTIVVDGGANGQRYCVRFSNGSGVDDMTGLKVRGNILQAKGSTDYVLSKDATISAANLTLNNNLVHATVKGSSGTIYLWNGVATTLATMQGANSKESATVYGDPLFVSATTDPTTADYHVGATSPAKTLAPVIAGLTLDIDGNARSSTTPTAGAYE